jgi:hypothetical protein
VQGVRPTEEHEPQHPKVYGVSHAAAAAAGGSEQADPQSPHYQPFTLNSVDLGERELVELLYNPLVAAKKKAGENVTGDFDSFTTFVQKKTDQIRKKYHCENVEYSVELANGEVKLKAKDKG